MSTFTVTTHWFNADTTEAGLEEMAAAERDYFTTGVTVTVTRCATPAGQTERNDWVRVQITFFSHSMDAAVRSLSGYVFGFASSLVES